jgi:hypothetical protein
MFKKIREFLINFQIEVIFSLFYFFIVIPTGLILKIFSDPLQIKRKKFSYWIERTVKEDDLETTRKQY